MKKNSLKSLKKLKLDKKAIAELTTINTTKVMGGATENTCVQYSIDKACDSLRTFTKTLE
jgi:hypothetical protein